MVNGDDLYQVSCTVVDCGRNLPKSKRCIRWRFGIIDEEARSNGANGMDCKGKEYEVTLLWSVTSGKRLVQLNGTQVHFSRGKRTDGKFQVQWNDEELGMEFVVIAHAAPPIRARENWKQFELRCNSKSFDDMIPVCSLGVDSSPKNHRAALTSRVSEMKSPKKMDDPSGAKSDIEERIHLNSDSDAQSIPETELPKAAIESDDLSIVEDDNTDYLSDEIDEDRPASKSEKFSQFEEEGLDYDASADHASADNASEDDDDDDYDYDDISEDSLTSHLFECNWNDADDDEMNPNEPPSLAAIERGNTKAKKKDPLSYDQVWGKLDSKRNANKKYSHKSPTSVKDYEGYFKQKKEREFSPMRKIDLKSLSRKTPLGKDRSYSEV